MANESKERQVRAYKTRQDDDDIFYTKRQTEWITQKIEKEFSPVNLRLVKQYHDILITSSLARITILKQLKTLYYLTQYYGKDWDKFTKEDSIQLISRIMQEYSKNGQESSTTFDFKKILKIWIRWIHTGQRYKADLDTPDPEAIRWIRIKKVKNKIAREDLLTEEDRTKLIHACNNARDRALIDVHLEAGTRPGEILSLQIKHAKVDNMGAIISVEGKTGQRQIRIVRSVKYLTDWLNIHPFKDNPNAPLFLSVKARSPKGLTYSVVRRIIQNTAKKANISKRIYLKLFRHTEITRAITDLNFNEEMLKKRHGWTNDSKMASVYVHAVNDDANNAYLRALGLVEQDSPKGLMFKVCPACQHRNNTDVQYCENCTKPLDLKIALELDDQVKNLQSKIEQIETDRELEKLNQEHRLKSEKIQILHDIIPKTLIKDEQKAEQFQNTLELLISQVANLTREIEKLKKNT